MKKLKLIFPQWQGGDDQHYLLGTELLNTIIPNSTNIPTLTVPIKTESNNKNGQECAYQEELLQQNQLAFNMLKIKQPKQIITLGGDCSSSQAPIDYLNGVYQKKIGVLWIDAHPDVADNKTSHHLFEMPAANLLHHGAPAFNRQVMNPLSTNQIFFAGLIKDQLRPMDQLVNRLNLNALSPEELSNLRPIKDWIKTNNFNHLYVHLDLDVLDYHDFRNIYPGQPHIDINQFPWPIGRLHFKKLTDIFKTVQEISSVVGLTIAEHIDWDAINLRHALNELKIFK